MILLVILTLQSCSHIATYIESPYDSSDSPYPVTSMRFSYYANNRDLSGRLKNIGNSIYKKISSDSYFHNYLSSAVEYEHKNGDCYEQRKEYEKAIADAAKMEFSSKDKHSKAISESDLILDKLSKHIAQESQTSNCDYWTRIFQLSHRGIIQHYANSAVEYNRLGQKSKELVYGYLLEKDIVQCADLAKQQVANEESYVQELQANVTKIKDKHQSLLNEEILKIKEEIQKEKERQLAQQRKAQEEARRERLNRMMTDLSCTRGTWLSETNMLTVFRGGTQQYRVTISSGIAIEGLINNRWVLLGRNISYRREGKYLILDTGDRITMDFANGRLIFDNRVMHREYSW